MEGKAMTLSPELEKAVNDAMRKGAEAVGKQIEQEVRRVNLSSAVRRGEVDVIETHFVDEV